MDSPLVLAKVEHNDITFFQYPNHITRELHRATRFSKAKSHIPGYSYISVQKAEELIRDITMRSA